MSRDGSFGLVGEGVTLVVGVLSCLACVLCIARLVWNTAVRVCFSGRLTDPFTSNEFMMLLAALALLAVASYAFACFEEGHSSLVRAVRRGVDLMDFNKSLERRRAAKAARERERIENWCRPYAERVFSGLPENGGRTVARCVVDGLGMGMLGIDDSHYKLDASQVSDEEFVAEWKLVIERDKEIVDAAASIWHRVLRGQKLDYSGDVEAVVALGRDLGVDSCIAAFLDGVPLEYVVAQ